MKPIPFNHPFLTGRELELIGQAYQSGQLAGDGSFTHQCHTWLEQQLGCTKALLTHSCTSALEMAAILADLEPGDEVIMPSYTFVSTANAFVLRGAVPVFVDIRPDTLNLDETLVESAITHRTRAIAPVHYAGVGCEMDELQTLATKYNLLVIEDAAQGIYARYRDQPLGTIGDLGCLSFHETKNIISGEGGALLINRDRFVERAEIIREKGTNRSQFFRGEIDKYTWIDIGSSYLPGEIIAAFLYAQLELADQIIASRLKIWDHYHNLLASLEEVAKIRRPQIPKHCQHNGHMYYILLPNLTVRTDLITYLKQSGIKSVFHYVPLHSSPAGQRYGRTQGDLVNTDRVADRLLRLPLFPDLSLEHVQDMVDAIKAFFAML
ncbi:dTDP-4-amino-4,6-dideoxygalactose transaminase [Candidatus Synechococcus calcipolaris G9]|uniref:dTDP-4-amino-4,6-dideoxygalactose transaminase n=1 Tax=Candidatus Synechococcus calcipolaris G9 TaxID=1497997 RepID=A0ABT6F3G8_9SYNE|nr:dTDP-4-amino-4,6-dideoxygalactose transaminase [Candidatus Synechococcus calcipolaris]MDG2992409.1 dTDP-4-amino-4,6-dideoxygalactose transaminase [Candidatus Synechococcus calcipolaris G9]